jgi:hypothetical protein
MKVCRVTRTQLLGTARVPATPGGRMRPMSDASEPAGRCRCVARPERPAPQALERE